ncbi:MAG: YggS family pyridoxal phosphate-dependent enzyme [Burkholderiaceae bacterium]
MSDDHPALPDEQAVAAAGERRLAVLNRIESACNAAGRNPDSVSLLAVSKTFDGSHCLAMMPSGQRSFGENYLQEALEKQRWLADQRLPGSPEWHFIGPIQSNKTKPIAEHFDWVHTVDRLKIAQRLNDQRPEDQPALQICLQVNIDNEETKSGCTPSEAVALAQAFAALPRLNLRGLMAIPTATDDTSKQRTSFAAVRELADQCRNALPPADAEIFDTLSMGMTGDLESAIAEGATLVRVGTALFGARSKKTV